MRSTAVSLFGLHKAHEITHAYPWFMLTTGY